MFVFLLKTIIYSFWRNAHDPYTNPLARPLLIALQVVRTSFGFHLREGMGSSLPSVPFMWDFRSLSKKFDSYFLNWIFHFSLPRFNYYSRKKENTDTDNIINEPYAVENIFNEFFTSDQNFRANYMNMFL